MNPRPTVRFPIPPSSPHDILIIAHWTMLAPSFDTMVSNTLAEAIHSRIMQSQSHGPSVDHVLKRMRSLRGTFLHILNESQHRPGLFARSTWNHLEAMYTIFSSISPKRPPPNPVNTAKPTASASAAGSSSKPKQQKKNHPWPYTDFSRPQIKIMVETWAQLSNRLRHVDLTLARQILSRIRSDPLKSVYWPPSITPVHVLQKMAEMLQTYHRNLTVANSAGVTNAHSANTLWYWFEAMHEIFGGLRSTSTPSQREEGAPWDSRLVTALVKLWAAYFNSFSRKVEIPLASHLAKELKSVTGSKYEFQAHQVLQKMEELMKLYREAQRDKGSGQQNMITYSNLDFQWFAGMREIFGDSCDVQSARNHDNASPSEQPIPQTNGTTAGFSHRDHGISSASEGRHENDVEFNFVASPPQQNVPQAEWTSADAMRPDDGDDDVHADGQEHDDVEKGPSRNPEGERSIPSGSHRFPNLRDSPRPRVKIENDIANTYDTNGVEQGHPVNNISRAGEDMAEKNAAASQGGVKHRVKSEGIDVRAVQETHRGAGDKGNSRSLKHHIIKSNMTRPNSPGLFEKKVGYMSLGHSDVQEEGASSSERVAHLQGDKDRCGDVNNLRPSLVGVRTQDENPAAAQVAGADQGEQDIEMRDARMDKQRQNGTTAVSPPGRKPMDVNGFYADLHSPISTGDTTAKMRRYHTDGALEIEDVHMAQSEERQQRTQDGGMDAAILGSSPADGTISRACSPQTVLAGTPSTGKRKSTVEGHRGAGDGANLFCRWRKEGSSSTAGAGSQQPERRVHQRKVRPNRNSSGCASAGKEGYQADGERLRPSHYSFSERNNAEKMAPLLAERKGRRYLVGAGKTQAGACDKSQGEVEVCRKRSKRRRDDNEVAAMYVDGDREGVSADGNLENLGEMREQRIKMRRTTEVGDLRGREEIQGTLPNSQGDSEMIHVHERVQRLDLRRREMDIKKQELDLRERELDMRFREVKLKELELKARKEEAEMQAAEFELKKIKSESARSKEALSVFSEEKVELLRTLRETATSMEQGGNREAATRIMALVTKIINEGRDAEAHSADN
eukprot:GFKZ01009882.1.p1 GENE.GFKZ01009882.1~~GFKZ01009882.1.p1  ORF type:complete len:1107 (+),score=171.25 GFKZ01009882.1:105-3323(+)